MKKFFLAVCLVFVSLSGKAIEVANLNPIEQMKIPFAHFTKPMAFNITLPATYHQNPDKRYVVLFDLHPRSQPYLSGMHDWLSHNGEWPMLESIIVTPTQYHAQFAKLFEQTTKKPSDRKLLNFLQNHVLKTLDDNYRTNGFKIYSGFMSNAAIGLYALINQPNMFNAYLIAAPTLANDFLNINSQFAAKVQSIKGKSRFLYLTIGQHRYEADHIKGVKALESDLQKHQPTNLDWQVVTDAPEYYMSRPLMTVLHGIEKLFDDYHKNLTADSAIAKQGVQAIIAYYNRLSNHKYGFEVSAQGALKNLAVALFEHNQVKSLAIYQQIVALYPESAYAYADLAAVKFRLGDVNKAIELQRIAVDKSQSLSGWHQNRIKKTLNDYLNRQ